ncbi:MAG: hypothetical protein AAFR81_19240 [Chloroflexota bacterium]
MNHETAKKHLKDGYEINGFDVVSELPNGETLLRYPHPATTDVTLKISNDDVEEYAELLGARGEFEKFNPTSLANPNYRESILIPLDASIDERDIDDLRFRESEDRPVYVEIDTISLVFANFFRFETGYMKLCLDKLLATPKLRRQASAKHPLDVRAIFANPLSARVFNLDGTSIDDAIQRSQPIVEGALFTLAYELGIPLMLAEDFPRTRLERRDIIRANDHKLHDIILPDDNFRHDLVRYYQAGLSSPIATQQFMSFYQILELFFQDVNHTGVHDQLYHLLRDENFRPDNATLAKIVQLVEATKGDLTTVDVLETLMRQHIDSNAIKEFVIQSGAQAEESLRGLAERVVTTRDAILNAGVNGLPPSDTSVAKDVPLVRFLAEQIIIATRT